MHIFQDCYYDDYYDFMMIIMMLIMMMRTSLTIMLPSLCTSSNCSDCVRAPMLSAFFVGWSIICVIHCCPTSPLVFVDNIRVIHLYSFSLRERFKMATYQVHVECGERKPQLTSNLRSGPLLPSPSASAERTATVFLVHVFLT
jgi:hypothetical protein